MESLALEYLAAGGDVGVLLIAYFVWRMERRLFKLELHTGLADLTRG